MKKKLNSTYEKFSKNKKQKRLLNREFRDLFISELLLAAMEEDRISVRKLASEADVSSTIIQSLKVRYRKVFCIDFLFIFQFFC